MLNGRNIQDSDRTRIKAFILQEDRFHSWLWAHHVPSLHGRQRKSSNRFILHPQALGSGDGPDAHVTTPTGVS